MRCLVVHANPTPDGYGAALRDAAVAGLGRGGHEVRIVDLYAEGFRAAMTAEERRCYHDADPILDPQVREHAEHVRWAEAIVFVYPTWWAGLPAVLKGWLERVMVNGVAFRHVPTDDGHTVKPHLRHVRRIVGITTYGSGRWFSFLVADGGRRTLLRALYVTAPRRTRRIWLGLYGIEARSPAERQAFLQRVGDRMARL